MKRLLYASVICLFTLAVSACSDSLMEEFDEVKSENDGALGGGYKEPPVPD